MIANKQGDVIKISKRINQSFCKHEMRMYICRTTEDIYRSSLLLRDFSLVDRTNANTM